MKNKLLLVLFIGIIISFLFYWFQWRPSEIRKMCEHNASNKYKGSYQRIRLNNFYRACLVQNGLKPESIFVNIGGN